MTTEHRNAHEGTFKTSDGVELFYRHWESNNNENKDKAIIMFHRGHEHSGRLQHIVDELEMPDCDFFAWDARGHGMSPGERGYSPSVARSTKDIEEFVRFISENYHIALENIIVIAQSVGAALAATWFMTMHQKSEVLFWPLLLLMLSIMCRLQNKVFQGCKNLSELSM